MNEIISQLKKLNEEMNEWMNEWWWMNERMSKWQMDGWNNFKRTNDVTWLNDSNQ